MNFKYSLEEFLSLPDSDDKSEFLKPMVGRDWLWLYNSAKASYEQYGEEGPPVGTKVTTLFAGHGGGAGAIRTFVGVYWADERFFVLSRREKDEKEDRISLVNRKYWWREILPREVAWKEIPYCNW